MTAALLGMVSIAWANNTAPVEVKAPELPPGQAFNLAQRREGREFTLTVDGQMLHRGRTATRAIGSAGLDPGRGTVRLFS